MIHRSLWLDTCELPTFQPLDRDLGVDVLVVGGGITGLTAAYLLAKAGKQVALVERGRLARVDTAHTTAHLTAVTDTRLTSLVKTFGKDHAFAAWDAGQAAIEQIETISRAERIDCDFQRVPGFLTAALFQDDPETGIESLQQDCELAAEAGFDVAMMERVPGIAMARPGMKIGGQAKFHIRKYLAGLVDRFVALGGRIFEQTSADEFDLSERQIKAGGYVIRCDQVVMATHAPLGGFQGTISTLLMHTKVAAYDSYVIGARLPRGALPEALWWDTSDPYYYLRVEEGADHDYAIFGGEDVKTGQTPDQEERYRRLEGALLKVIPQAIPERRWTGQWYEPSDGLPYIGRENEAQIVCTGFSGNGMTFGTLSGLIARDLILGDRNPWADLFDPSRKTLTLSHAWDYVRENKDYPYYLVKSRLFGATSAAIDLVRPGEGEVIKLHGSKVAVYRSPEGKVSKVSAVCPHLGCIVAWNTAEKVWDCPCHGSRFNATGEVIGGPAECGLKHLPEPAS